MVLMLTMLVLDLYVLFILCIELLVELHYVQVKLVGMVRNRAGRITDVTFALDDGTGRIDCSKWFVLPPTTAPTPTPLQDEKS